MKKQITMLLAVVCVIGCKKAPNLAADDPEWPEAYPWVMQCGGPPRGWVLVTNDVGNFAVSNIHSGCVLAPSLFRQDAINWAWQYEMWLATEASKPSETQLPQKWAPSL